MTAIQMQLHPTRYASTTDLDLDDNSSGPGTNSEGTETQSVPRSKRSGSIASWNSISKDTFVSSGAMSSTGLSAVQQSLNGSTTSFQHSPGAESKPLSGSLQVVYDRNWEMEMEGLLKVQFVCRLSGESFDWFGGCRKCIRLSRVSRFCNRLVWFP